MLKRYWYFFQIFRVSFVHLPQFMMPIFHTKYFCWILIDFHGQKMGNDERKRIPNQNHAKWPHKHHEMSTKLIHNSTRIPFNIFLKEKNHFSKSLVLAKIIPWKTLWKSESVFLPHQSLETVSFFPDEYCSLDLYYLSLLHSSVQYFQFLDAWSIHMDCN